MKSMMSRPGNDSKEAFTRKSPEKLLVMLVAILCQGRSLSWALLLIGALMLGVFSAEQGDQPLQAPLFIKDAGVSEGGSGMLPLMTLFLPAELHAADSPDKLYSKGKYTEAEQAYRKLDMDKPQDLRYRYNRGCAAYEAGSLDEAEAAFRSVSVRSKDKDMRFSSLYNLGNTAYKKGDFAAAGDSYREALKIRPGDADAKHNLELSMKALKKQQEASKDKGQKGRDQAGKDGNDKGRNSSDQNRKDGKSGDKEQEKPGEKGGSKDGKDQQGKGDKQGQADQQPGNTTQGRQGQDPGSMKQGDNSPQQGGRSDRQQEKQDLSGELKGKNMTGNNKDMNRGAGSEAMMERKKAEALLDNVGENRAMFKARQGSGGRYSVGSGKEW